MYLLDANVFIQSHRAHYGLDFVPGFWEWIDVSFAAGTLESIHPIAVEIAAGHDDLSEWAAASSHLFVPMDAACAPSLSAISTWVNGASYTPGAVAEFLSVADYQLVAFARTHGHTVVTMERSEPQRKSKVKIPDVCNAHGITWTTPFQMLRDERASLVLGP
ncbi:DUF4411 family protein [Microbacterium sp. ZW T6_19]|uniref:DUF4411 family protein n=1 Tax=Microbacterium sp. ZW T6_19 TaxID=3378082 RepID=UPI003855173E